jgi:hypothetical protein
MLPHSGDGGKKQVSKAKVMAVARAVVRGSGKGGAEGGKQQ